MQLLDNNYNKNISQSFRSEERLEEARFTTPSSSFPPQEVAPYLKTWVVLYSFQTAVKDFLCQATLQDRIHHLWSALCLANMHTKLTSDLEPMEGLSCWPTVEPYLRKCSSRGNLQPSTPSSWWVNFFPKGTGSTHTKHPYHQGFKISLR